jgi:YhcH/YjgK/YiaL family protein
MIYDRLENRRLYLKLGDGIALGLEALAGDLPKRDEGRYDLLGDRVFAMVQIYDTIPPEQAVWEAHRKYIDIQYIAEGAEAMGHLPVAGLRATHPYDAEKDYEFYDGHGSKSINTVTVPAGAFAIFFPADAHSPKLPAYGKIARVKKVVVKVAVD